MYLLSSKKEINMLNRGITCLHFEVKPHTNFLFVEQFDN